ncbi:MAG: J domain-containing protein [Alphaproteobacteria bacterium]|nr:J domain-containing protein [Alphaproteobacteria bacterium]
MGAIRGLTQSKRVVIVPCPSWFVADVLATAEQQSCSVAELARSILLVFSDDHIDLQPDPGEPQPGDRDRVVILSGNGGGGASNSTSGNDSGNDSGGASNSANDKQKVIKRKPRLQLRLSVPAPIPRIRRALNLAVQLHRGAMQVTAESTSTSTAQEKLERTTEQLETANGFIEKMRFEPLGRACHSTNEMRYVLGFPPTEIVSLASCTRRYRTLATVFHPDSPFGDHMRMSELNEAMRFARQLFR